MESHLDWGKNVKPTVTSLRVGQKVWATIEELLDQEQVIVSFNGDLLRVVNRAGQRLRPGQRIQLHVEAVNPLQFRFVEAKRLNLGINIEI